MSDRDDPSQSPAKPTGSKFIWPPSKGEPTRDPQATDAASATSGAFERKPNRRPVVPGTSVDLDLIDRPTTSRWLSAIDEIEQAWLDPVALPMRRVMELSGWRPDPSGAYCWRCGQTASHHEVADFGCAQCRDEKVAWDRFVRVGEFAGPLATMIKQTKYSAWRTRGAGIGKLMGRAIRDEVELRIGADVPVAIVPVPMSFWHRVTRGIDHALVMARAAAAAGGLELTPILGRSHRPTQATMSSTDRQKNVRGSMKSKLIAPLAWKRFQRVVRARGVVVVLDDVKTTGATLGEATKVIRTLIGPDRAQEVRIWACSAGVTPTGD